MKAKKSYGQHFLINEGVLQKIANTLNEDSQNVLEVGPGKGALSKYLFSKQTINYRAIEADREMVAYLVNHYPDQAEKIIEGDFLKLNFQQLFEGNEFTVIGNFPYNISSQIVFKIIENRSQVPLMIGMFQKELAERIVANHGSKTYGVISVLTRAYYDAELLFHVSPGSFQPPPKVMSTVISLKRKTHELQCDEKLFKRIVKQGFGQRRKMLRNTLKSLIRDENRISSEILSKRPEALSFEEFVELTITIQNQ